MTNETDASTAPLHRGAGPARRLWLLILLISLLAVGVSVIGLRYAERRLVTAVGDTLSLAAAETAGKVDRVLAERRSDLLVAAAAPILRGKDRQAMSRFLSGIRAAYAPYYLWLGLTDAQGTIVAASDQATVGRDRSGAAWFRAVRDGLTFHLADVEPFEEAGGTDALAFTARVEGPNGEFLGAVTARVGIVVLEEAVTQTLRTFRMRQGFSGHLEYQFISESGEAFVDSELALKGRANLLQMGLPSAHLSRAGVAGFVEEDELRRHVPVITGYASTQVLDGSSNVRWGILVRMDRQDAVAPIHMDMARLGGLSLLLWLPMLGLLLWTARSLVGLYAYAREREEWLATTLRSIGDGVIATDERGAILFMNPVAQDLTGWPQRDAKGRPLEDVFRIVQEKGRKPVENPAMKVLREGIVVGVINRTMRIAQNGVERMVDASAAPIKAGDGRSVGVVLVFRDVTGREKIEQQLLVTNKLESVGLLAGGIAHDFNNILTAILGNISLAKQGVDQEGKLFRRLSEAESAAIRATGLTQQLLTFSKGGQPVKRVSAIGRLLPEWAGFVLGGSKVRLECIVPEDLWPVDIDEGQMGQVLHNLLLNAQQAMPDGGIATIRVANVVLQAAEAGPPLPLPDGRYVKVMVEDHGCGIAPDVLPRIFDPYYTTKATGSGLGLATSFAIVRNHGGHLAAQSRLGGGAEFSIYLPASFGGAADPNRDDSVRQGSGLVLIVDDAPAIRAVAAEMLTQCGYEAREVSDGDQAVQAYKRAKDEGRPFAAVLMDLTIPGGVGGLEAFKRLRVFDPQVKVIVSSGYATDPVLANYRRYGFSGMVAKPYRLVEFSQVLDQVTRGGDA